MLYTICIALILVASVLVILAVLVQNPKSGMAANFGASNQVMGVRETTNFLEKFTWAMAIAIVVLSLVATLAMDRSKVAESNSEISKDAKALQERVLETEAAAMPQAEIPAAEEVPAAETPATEAPAETPAAEQAGRSESEFEGRGFFRGLFCICIFRPVRLLVPARSVCWFPPGPSAGSRPFPAFFAPEDGCDCTALMEMNR